jgi:hypothetical protein
MKHDIIILEKVSKILSGATIVTLKDHLVFHTKEVSSRFILTLPTISAIGTAKVIQISFLFCELL